MSSTNKTTNYDLSQFVGSDKPAWLADYNQDMSKIDTQMKANADGVTAANGKADTNTTNIGDMSYLSTTAKNTVVAAINEVDSNADTAQNTATQAAATATSAKNEADALNRYINITQNGPISITVSGGTLGNINDMHYALNADGTYGKIYGRFRVVSNTTGTVTVTLTLPTTLNVSNSFTINCAVNYTSYTPVGNLGWTEIGAKDITVNTDNTITLTYSGQDVGSTQTFWMTPCLYFFTDFGDVYNPNV